MTVTQFSLYYCEIRCFPTFSLISQGKVCGSWWKKGIFRWLVSISEFNLMQLQDLNMFYVVEVYALLSFSCKCTSYLSINNHYRPWKSHIGCSLVIQTWRKYVSPVWPIDRKLNSRVSLDVSEGVRQVLSFMYAKNDSPHYITDVEENIMYSSCVWKPSPSLKVSSCPLAWQSQETRCPVEMC